MNDQSLLTLLYQDKNRGLESVMKQYAGLVYTIVFNKLSFVSGTEDIEECISDVFFTFSQSFQNVDLDRGSLKSYLAVMATRKAISRYRSLVSFSEMVPLDDNMALQNDSTPEELFFQNISAKALVNAINKLGEPDREIIIRKYYFRQSSKEISKAIHSKPNTVDSRVHRALKKLRDLMMEVENGPFSI